MTIKISTKTLYNLGLLSKALDVIGWNYDGIELGDGEMHELGFTKEQAEEIGIPPEAMVTK